MKSSATTAGTGWNAWGGAIVIALALAVAAPILFVLASLTGGVSSSQEHIWTTSGLLYLRETLLLCLMVAAAVSIIGAGAAAFVSLTEFPGRRLFSVALILPFAIPAYVGAYVYGDLFGPFGALRESFGAQAPLPEIRSLPGAAFILSLALYPYVYLAVRASLAARSGAFLEASRVLGASPSRTVLAVLLPAGRAAFAGGLALALMETVADYGVADYFGVSTLSVGIFRTWHGLGDLAAASQLAGGLFLLALLFVLLEERSRGGLGADSARAHRSASRLKLSPLAATFAILFCAAPIVFGFALPVAVLGEKLFGPIAKPDGFLKAAADTGLVVTAGTLTAIVAATILAYAARRVRGPARLGVRLATMGYALPGAVMAIGLLAVAAGMRTATGAAISGIALLVYAYAARFLTAGYNAVSGGLAQIHPQTDDAARALGAGSAVIFSRLHWPLARGSIAAGALIVAIDIARELPATLLLRPFNFETMATHVYRLASDERLADAAPAALVLIGVSLAPVILLETIGRRREA